MSLRVGLVLVLIVVCVVAPVGVGAYAPGRHSRESFNANAYTFDMSRVAHYVDTGQFFGVAHWPKSDADKKTFLPLLRKYGIRLVRGDLYLQDVLSEKVCPDLKTYQSKISDPKFVDSWDWSQASWLAEAKQQGFRTMGIFCYMPKCLTANGSLPRKGDTAAWEAWGDVCAKAYERLGKNISYLEIFNEAHFFTKPDGTDYKRSVDADPDIFYYAQNRLRPLSTKSIGGAVTWIDCWAGSALDTLPFDPRTKRDSIDYFDIHIYDTEPGAFFSRVDHTRAVLDGTGNSLPFGYKAPWKDKPIWVTEWNQYWKGKRYGMDWYGFALTEFLKRGIPNIIYNTNEFFDPTKPSQAKPWLLMVGCGLNGKGQTVRVNLEDDARPFGTESNSTVCTLPGGDVVILATNTTGVPIVASWNLTRMNSKSLKNLRLRKWDAVGEGPELTTADADQSGSLQVGPSGCYVAYTLAPHSITALKLEHKK